MARIMLPCDIASLAETGALRATTCAAEHTAHVSILHRRAEPLPRLHLLDARLSSWLRFDGRIEPDERGRTLLRTTPAHSSDSPTTPCLRHSLVDRRIPHSAHERPLRPTPTSRLQKPPHLPDPDLPSANRGRRLALAITPDLRPHNAAPRLYAVSLTTRTSTTGAAAGPAATDAGCWTSAPGHGLAPLASQGPSRGLQ